MPDLDRIVPVLLEHGLERLPEHCSLSPGTTHRPSKLAVAHPLQGRFKGPCQVPTEDLETPLSPPGVILLPGPETPFLPPELSLLDTVCSPEGSGRSR